MIEAEFNFDKTNNIILQSSEAKRLAADLLRAIEESTDHMYDFPIDIVSHNLKEHYILWVKPEKIEGDNSEKG